MTPTFDEWFVAKYGLPFERLYMQPMMRTDIAFRALTTALRDYTTEMVQVQIHNAASTSP